MTPELPEHDDARRAEDVPPPEEGPIPSEPPSLRASDADRSETVRVLQDAVARGLLTPEEGSERMAAAWAARHVHQLPPLTADLPPAVAAGGATTAPGWRPLAAMAVARARTTVGDVRAAGLRSPRSVALLAAVVVALLLVGLLGGMAVHELFDGGPGGFGPR
ncbi:DUF1707 domain-containing protein [Geodermatophilus sp. TF02-6]|uniref:DUF1707 SHOCT-like domain-containing protein n=1 Tax=Geodermatophilus sp. TF02-6 TaxID=2250575 RepID=UPI001313EE2A|nr:DUF1707 domain-containing protein [Geodermatophilus sp. TF02-6]